MSSAENGLDHLRLSEGYDTWSEIPRVPIYEAALAPSGNRCRLSGDYFVMT